MARTAAPPATTFRTPFWRMYLPAVMYSQMFYGVGMWLILLVQSRFDGQPFPTASQSVVYAANSAGVSLLLVPVLFVYVRRLVVRVSADGITCPNGIGKLVTVPWESINGVKPFHLPGLPYLMVLTDHTRKKLWLPLFLREMPEFVEKVEHYAGGDHILFQALWPRVEANR